MSLIALLNRFQPHVAWRNVAFASERSGRVTSSRFRPSVLSRIDESVIDDRAGPEMASTGLALPVTS